MSNVFGVDTSPEAIASFERLKEYANNAPRVRMYINADGSAFAVDEPPAVTAMEHGSNSR